jgi:CheY-like chemotaxis protein
MPPKTYTAIHLRSEADSLGLSHVVQDRKRRRSFRVCRSEGNVSVTILVVEDDQEAREALADVLSSEGYQVVLAGNGLEALELLNGGLRPAVALVDLQMPVMDGWRLLAQLRSDPRFQDLRVVVMSASHERIDGHGYEYWKKPDSARSLLTLIQKGLGG